MPVESEKVEAWGGRMVKDDDGAVIKRRGIVGERVNRGVKRSGNGSAGFYKEIKAKMNGAALRKRIVAITEKLRGIKGPRLVVTADPDGGVCGA